MPNLIVAERHAQSGSSRELSSKRLRLLILVLLFACETSFGIKLICHRHHSLASWLSFHEPNNASFILKCREDTSKIEKGSQIPSQVTIVSNAALMLDREFVTDLPTHCRSDLSDLLVCPNGFQSSFVFRNFSLCTTQIQSHSKVVFLTLSYSFPSSILPRKVSGLEEWMAKCNRLSCILNGLRHEPKQHLLANSLLVLKWIFKKLLDELIDFIFQHYLPSSRTEPVPGLMTNMTENMVKIHQI